eukprot:21636_1
MAVYHVSYLYQEQFVNIILLSDAYITAICLIFQFESLESMYNYFCHGVDGRCRYLCFTFVNPSHSQKRVSTQQQMYDAIEMQPPPARLEVNTKHEIFAEIKMQPASAPLIEIDSEVNTKHEIFAEIKMQPASAPLIEIDIKEKEDNSTDCTEMSHSSNSIQDRLIVKEKLKTVKRLVGSLNLSNVHMHLIISKLFQANNQNKNVDNLDMIVEMVMKLRSEERKTDNWSKNDYYQNYDNPQFDETKNKVIESKIVQGGLVENNFLNVPVQINKNQDRTNNNNIPLSHFSDDINNTNESVNYSSSISDISVVHDDSDDCPDISNPTEIQNVLNNIVMNGDLVDVTIDYDHQKITIGGLPFTTTHRLKLKKIKNTSIVYIEDIRIKCASVEHAQWLIDKVATLTSSKIIIDTRKANTPPPQECQLIATQCDQINSITQSLLVYHRDIKPNPCDNDMLSFVELCENRSNLLDDYIHLILDHDHDLEHIHDSLCVNKQFKECNVHQCLFSRRHHRNRGKDDTQNIVNNYKFMFYRDLMDSTHWYLFHLWDYGFRRRKQEIKHKNRTNKSVDNKYSFQLNTNKYAVMKQYDGTFMDALYEQMINTDMQYAIRLFLSEEYDTDAIEMDILYDKHGNIGKTLNNAKNSNVWIFSNKQKEHHEFILEYTYQCKVMERTFRIGYTFYYWKYYKNATNENEQHFANRNDFHGHQPHQLYIQQIYSSLKEEILNNRIKTLSVSQYYISLNKAIKFMETSKVKQMKIAPSQLDRLKYHDYVKEHSIITLEHLLSIILRCDWSELCSTFRRSQLYEPLSSVKMRNTQYAIWSRLIRETVELFGYCRFGDYDRAKHEYVKKKSAEGPFFSGMNFVMTIPEFNIRLCGPVSTTKQIEVAETFATNLGMVIQLDNTGHCNAGNLRMFCCSWISDYNGEDEYLFVGGQFQIQIQSIRAWSQAEQKIVNYQEYCKALWLFDCMIKGTAMEDGTIDVSDHEYSLVNNLIKYTLGRHKTRPSKYGIPKYIINVFGSFVRHHTQIVINLYQLHEHFGKMKDLIIYSGNEKTNLLKNQIFTLFKNIQNITIYTTKHNGQESHQINLFKFLTIMDSLYGSSTKTFTVTIKATRDEWAQNTHSWLFERYKLLRQSGLDLKRCTLKLVQTNDDEKIIEDCLIINKDNTYKE